LAKSPLVSQSEARLRDFGIVGPVAQRLFVAGQRRREITLLAACDSQVGMSLGIVGFQLNRLGEARHGFVHPAQLGQDHAQVVVGLGQARMAPYRFGPAALAGIVELAESPFQRLALARFCHNLGNNDLG
jgi:hypothetical protein